MANKQDSNRSGLSYAFETIGTPGVLPGSPDWYELEPNSYGDFGGEYSTVAREPINASRQRLKGTVADLDISGAFNSDWTQNNMKRILQMFAFANLREAPNTKPYNGAAIPFTSTTSGSKTYTASGGGLAVFLAKMLVYASGFGSSTNNGLKTVASSTGTTVVVAETVVTEASPPAAAKLEAVGVQFASGDATMTVAADTATLGTTAFDLTTLPLKAGQWVYVGGDSAAFKFATGATFYGRIKSISATAIVFDKTAGTPLTDSGTGKTIQMFFGPLLRNEEVTANIITRSATFERTLGNDGSGTQSEYAGGVFGNELTLNIPQADKLNVDMGFVGLSHNTRTGVQGPLSLASGTYTAALGEDCFNTSSNLNRLRIAPIDDTTLNPTPYFGYVSEGNITINNNLSVLKAVAVLGGFDVSVGNFEVGGSVTAYFSSVAAIAAVKAYSSVTMDFIGARSNAGFAIDLPYVGLGGGRLGVEKDQPITLPLEVGAFKHPTFLHTMAISWFSYLPTAAMPA